mmetsp:Transcript_6006/g.5174  ORF Transcript_6006/g.5174 Transcript_6006/m.5174 type:complete len:197 (+) Transcript_6006:925-1515(+)
MYFDYIFLAFITLAYIALFFSKYKLRQILKLKNQRNVRVKFKKHLSELENAERLLSVTKIEIDGKYFYEASYKCTSTRGRLFNDVNSELIRNSYYGASSNRGIPQILGLSRHSSYQNVSLPHSPILRFNTENDIILKGMDQSPTKRLLDQKISIDWDNDALSPMGLVTPDMSFNEHVIDYEEELDDKVDQKPTLSE